MKALSFLAGIAFMSLAFIRLNPFQKNENSNDTRKKVEAYKKKFTLGCAPDLASIDFSDPANSIPLLDGWGKYKMPVTAGNDSANMYFQQGINMYYSFHIIEALASFEKSITFDENFAMGYWGKRLATDQTSMMLDMLLRPKRLPQYKTQKKNVGTVLQ
jgi:hypothetical protein